MDVLHIYQVISNLHHVHLLQVVLKKFLYMPPPPLPPPRRWHGLFTCTNAAFGVCAYYFHSHSANWRVTAHCWDKASSPLLYCFRSTLTFQKKREGRQMQRNPAPQRAFPLVNGCLSHPFLSGEVGALRNFGVSSLYFPETN